MKPRAAMLRTTDDDRVRHLISAIGASAAVRSFGPLSIVRPAAVDAMVEDALGQAIPRCLQAAAAWTGSRKIALPRPSPNLAIGLFGERESYEDYLNREGLSGLTGSLGMTHPVRGLSAVLVSEAETSVTQLAAAHESIHLWALRTGLCPAWHAWPRWLHEGLAQLWDHLSAATDHPRENAPGRIAPNRQRQQDWKRIAASTDIERFLRQDMIADRRRHGADYATSWALAFGLVHWCQGDLLAELLSDLQVRDLQPYDGGTPESHCLDWLKSRLGAEWRVFTATLADLGRA